MRLPRALALRLSGIALAVSVPLAVWAHGAVGQLEARRDERAALGLELATLRGRPAPLPDPQRAELARRVRMAAAQGGVLIERLAASPDGVTIAASGGEKALLGFVNGLERGSPGIRFAAWRLGADPGGAALRFEAEAVAWRD